VSYLSEEWDEESGESRLVRRALQGKNKHHATKGGGHLLDGTKSQRAYLERDQWKRQGDKKRGVAGTARQKKKRKSMEKKGLDGERGARKEPRAGRKQ